jgi:putative endonuclease
MNEKSELGKRGEEEAASYFLNEGYEILHKNYRIGYSEVDLILKRGNLIVFAEIKSRSGAQPVREEELITRSKVRALIRAADVYLRRTPDDTEIRFDVVILEYRENTLRLKHIEDAFREAGDFYDL